MQVWLDSVAAVVRSMDNEKDKAIVQLFATQVQMDVQDNKIRFLCNSPVVYSLFLKFSTTFYDAAKSLLGREDLGLSVEVGASVSPSFSQPVSQNVSQTSAVHNDGVSSQNSAYDFKLNRETAVPQVQAQSTYGTKNFHNKNTRSGNINPNKTFENYVTDPENKLLYATAVAVAANPGTSNYNPFYIYGASGLGKTHLLFAIANRIRETHPEVSLIYTRAEEFIRHYVESMARIKKNPYDDERMHFQDLYTSYDVFIVDDIQNFIKADKTRDTFFDIIADFIDQPNRQLILASDVPPGNLKNFNPRLTSRFGSGVCCEVVPPSPETRAAITLKKCKELNADLPDDVIQYIALHIRSNVREIEGAIKTLNTHKQAFGTITTEDAVKILGNLVNASNQICTIDMIKERVSKEFGVPVPSMESAEKKKMVSIARATAMCLGRDLIPALSLSDIGRNFNKDHSSVHEAIKRTRTRIEEDPEYASRYRHLLLSLKKE